MTKIKDIIAYIGVIVFLLMVIAVCVCAVVKAREAIAEAKKPIYIDSTQVQVVYTDTWGKIFIMKEEDL